MVSAAAFARSRPFPSAAHVSQRVSFETANKPPEDGAVHWTAAASEVAFYENYFSFAHHLVGRLPCWLYCTVRAKSLGEQIGSASVGKGIMEQWQPCCGR